MPKPIQLSDVRFSRLCSLAAKAGYSIKRGPGGGIGEFVEALMDRWEALDKMTPDEARNMILRLAPIADDGDVRVEIRIGRWIDENKKKK